MTILMLEATTRPKYKQYEQLQCYKVYCYVQELGHEK